MDRELPSFQEVEEHHKDVSKKLRYVEQYVDSLSREVDGLETQIDAIISLYELAVEEQLKPIFNPDEVDRIQAEISALKAEIEEFEKFEARLVLQRDYLEVLDQKLQELVFKRLPTEEKNPDDDSIK